MMMSFRLAASLAIASIAACGYTSTHRVVTGQPGPPHQGEVALYMAGTPAPPLDEVAIVQAVGNGHHADLEHVVSGLKKEAARLGCDALANVKIDQGSSSASGTAICARLRPKGQPAQPEVAVHTRPPSPDASSTTPEVPPSSAPDAGGGEEAGSE